MRIHGHFPRCMQSWIVVAVSCALVVCMPLIAGAQPEGATAIQVTLRDHDIPGLDVPINLNAFEAWDVVQLIQFLAHRGGIQNIVIGKGVQGMNTRLKFDDVTVGDALEVVLTVNNLAYVVRNGIITIMTDGEYRMLYGRSFYDHKEVRVVPLEYADPARVAEILAPIKSTIGTIVSDPVSGTLILIDTPSKIDEMLAIIRKADMATLTRVIPTETREFRLQYADVTTMQNEITRLLSDQAGFLHADQRTRTLRVTDVPHIIRRIEDLVTLYDKRPRQVFIEAKIVEVSLTDDFRMGVNWNNVFEGLDPRFSLRTLSSPTPWATLGGDVRSPTGTVRYNAITPGGSLDVVLEALKAVTETKILSNPHVAVLDGSTASIEVVTQEPYGEAQLESGSTNIVGETIKFIDVGVTLAVTPRISDDSMINMEIKPSVSTVIRQYQAFRTVPVVRESRAETTVMIKDGETIIIAGMIVNARTDVENRVPFFGRIPLLGIFFRSVREDVQNNELIVFLTPRIISGERPFLRMEDVKKRPKPMRRAAADDDAKQLRPLR